MGVQRMEVALGKGQLMVLGQKVHQMDIVDLVGNIPLVACLDRMAEDFVTENFAEFAFLNVRH